MGSGLNVDLRHDCNELNRLLDVDALDSAQAKRLHCRSCEQQATDDFSGLEEVDAPTAQLDIEFGSWQLPLYARLS